MKITCKREPLAAAFQLAAGVAPSRTAKEILQNIKLSFVDGKLILEATDLEVGIRLEVANVEADSSGAILLPVQRTGAILRESNAEEMTIETVDNNVLIKAGRSRFRLPSANADEFPRVPGFDADIYHEISTGLFKELVRRTVFATDVESSRYALGGVLLELDADKVIAVATDGRRLARMEGTGNSVSGHKTNGMNTIVPVRAMALIDRALSDKDGTLQVAARANDLLVRTNQWTIYSRLVEGRYPNWRQVIPTRNKAICIELTVGPLFNALRQAAIVSDQESRGIDFTFSEGSLKLDANTAEIGESHVEIPIAFTGDLLKVTLDNRFVADFCKVLSPEATIVLNIESSDKPALLTTDDGYAYVIMPMSRDRK